jgi:hypothetical protein
MNAPARMFRAVRRLPGFAILTGGVAAGLFVARIASDFVPDALAIGVCMFAAGGLAGFVVGIVYRPRGEP